MIYNQHHQGLKAGVFTMWTLMHMCVHAWVICTFIIEDMVTILHFCFSTQSIINFIIFQQQFLYELWFSTIIKKLNIEC